MISKLHNHLEMIRNNGHYFAIWYDYVKCLQPAAFQKLNIDELNNTVNNSVA